MRSGLIMPKNRYLIGIDTPTILILLKMQGVNVAMEKNRMRPVKAGKATRVSYSKQKEVLEMPNLIEVQKDSYEWFLRDGLKEAFNDISPIEDHGGQLSLEFVDFQLCEDEAKYSIEECKERDATYEAPLKVKVRLYKKETGEIGEHEIFMGNLPLMTVTGTFVINGAERVIVSQLVFITISLMINLVRDYFQVLLFLTEVRG